VSLLTGDALIFCLNFNNTDNWLAARATREFARTTQYPVRCIPCIGSLGNVARDSASRDDPLAAYKARRAEARQKFATRELERNCEMLGITTDQGSRQTSSVSAARGLATLVQSHASEDDCWRYIEAVFTAHFLGARNIASESVVTELLGTDLTQSETDLQAIQSTLEDAGIFNTPSYLFGGERFHGRQHLPLIRWQIEGRAGLPPV